MRRRVTSHQPPMMTRDCGDESFTVRSCGGWRVVFFSLYVDTVMNAKFGEVAYTLHSNCDVWSPKLKKSLMFGLCHLFIVVSMSKLRNPIGEEAGIWPARKIMVMVEGLKMFRRNMQAGARNQVMRSDQRFKPENKLEKHEFTVHNKEISVHAIRQDFPEPLQ